MCIRFFYNIWNIVLRYNILDFSIDLEGIDMINF
jgi:hypothetical protein